MKKFLVINPKRTEFNQIFRYVAPGNPPIYDAVILCTDEQNGESKLFYDIEVEEVLAAPKINEGDSVKLVTDQLDENGKLLNGRLARVISVNSDGYCVRYAPKYKVEILVDKVRADDTPISNIYKILSA